MTPGAASGPHARGGGRPTARDPGFPITLIVAPVPGRVHVLPPRRYRGGREWLEHGEPVARLEHGGGSDAILAPVSGAIGGVLTRDGEPVKAGQPIAWMEAGEHQA
jgi:biotin carboxyl carrier protein